MYKTISKCPICGGVLRVTKLKCAKCNTTIENEFSFSKFESLSKEQLAFVEVFLKCRGNIKDVEKELGISYPTVRAKLDEVINELGLKEDNEKQKNDEILDKLERGEISAEEAASLLRRNN
ncbi:DUF2089 domain-containing protein [Clostridium sp. C8-1-8]|uniref:DUF2089 domain-containing protein n=1 Tax=Clostridium sp. C8-1-8 TaxID=2698831 RepID=UPI00136F05D5|nr:DUF2089 domain-containing protein [Clostridium sp. C8-1-8]